MLTYKKWQTNYEQEYQTLSWLRCDVNEHDKSLVGLLWCAVCRRFEERIRGVKNFSNVWITGSNNHKCSNVLDHARSDQHKAAMTRLRVEQSRAPASTYAPIARSLLTMDKTVQEKMKKKFDICFVMAKENMAFRKYPALHELEVRHGVDLGESYKTKDSAKVFTYYVAETQRHDFLHSLSSAHFFSFLMDGSIDAGNVEDELIVILYCKKDDAIEEIKSCVRYFTVEVPKKADANGLIECLSNALKEFGIEDILKRASVLGAQGKPVLIGGGTDGASVNVAEQNGMRGKMQRELPWLYWAWCYAHRLELACKDALSSQLFENITDMLLRLYYIYAKSPKKSRELSDIVIDLKEVFQFKEGGDMPVRSQGSRWIAHKRKALQRLVDRYGAYINHLTTLVADSSISSTDRARLSGYLHKWQQAKMLVGSALYVDVLKSPSLLSLTLQDDDLDIVLGLKHILKSVKSLKKLADQNPLEWPTIKFVRSRITDGNMYQGAVMQNFNTRTLHYCRDQALADLQQLDQQMRDRLEWSDVKMLRCILTFLDTQSWRRPVTVNTDNSSDSDEDDHILVEILSAVEYITSFFRQPLEAKGANLPSVRDEMEEIVEYARKYLSLDREGYRKVWYKLHISPDAVRWPNILLLCELGFSLPFSNGHVERLFSSLKLIKTDRRTRLQTSTLRDLLEIHTEGPPLASFSAENAVKLWWKDCSSTRRVNQGPRKAYRPREKASSDMTASPGPDVSTSSDPGTSSSSSDTLALQEWDSWFHPSDSEIEDSD